MWAYLNYVRMYEDTIAMTMNDTKPTDVQISQAFLPLKGFEKSKLRVSSGRGSYLERKTRNKPIPTTKLRP